MTRSKLKKLLRKPVDDERKSSAEIAKSTTFEIVSEANAAVVVEEETAGEAAEEMIEAETLEGEGSIADDIQDHRADVTLETEDISAHLPQENRIAMFPVAVVDADEMIAEDLLRQNRCLHLPGRNPNHVHPLLAVEIGRPQGLARQHLDDADLGLQIDVVLHIEAEEAEEEVRIVALDEDRQVPRHPVHVLHDHLSEEDPLHLHP
jgi:hypothetical protein